MNRSDFLVISTSGCRSHEWKLGKVRSVHKYNFNPNCFEKEDRFPFNNTATVNTSFWLMSFCYRGLLEWCDKICQFCHFKGPLKYLVAKLHRCYPGAISLPVCQKFFARFFRRRPVVPSPIQLAVCLTFSLRCNKHKKILFAYIFID